jgi:glycosyltransferase involved in cell wall biosynthesis
MASKETGLPEISRSRIGRIVSRLYPLERRQPDLSVLYVYRFCGLGGVETSITTKLRALAPFRADARALFLEHYGVGSEEIARSPGVLFGLGIPEIERLLREVDIVVVTDFPEFLDVIASSGSSARVVFESHASYPPALPRFYSRLESRSISAIVVPSEFNRRLMLQFGISRDDVHVIPNAVDARTFRPANPSADVLARVGASAAPLIVWVGRLEDQKSPLEFVRIGIGLLREERAFVGDTPQYEDSVAEIREEIPPQFHGAFLFLRGVVPSRMPDVYNAARVSGGCLVSTSLNESQPMVFLEAMACECPVVSTRVGGVPEILEDGRTGHLYDPGDDETARLAIVELADPGRRRSRQSMTRRARAAVRARHALSSVGARYRELFDGIR